MRASANDDMERERGRIAITGLKAIQLRQGSGQSLVRVETDAGVVGIGEAGADGETTSKTFGNGQDVRLNLGPLISK